jgi:pSer/pThr/pTyr-binding forkhead associated (FHA) protein
MEVKLVITNGKQAGKEIPIKSAKFVIGRNEDCELRPQSHLVSRRHCAILVGADSAAVEDLGSTNGTFLNDEKLVGRHSLKSGDRIKVGLLEVEVQLPVALGGKSKPKVESIQEAAARTAAKAAASDDDLDVTSWLGDEDSSLMPSPPAKKTPASDETIAGTSLVDTTAMPLSSAPPKKKEEEKKKEEPAKKDEPAKAKSVSKFNRQAKPTTGSSGSAADDALRNFFQRKKA